MSLDSLLVRNRCAIPRAYCSELRHVYYNGQNEAGNNAIQISN